MESLSTAAARAGIPCFTCGVGPAAAAHSLTMFLENGRVSVVVLAGIGGTYHESYLSAKKVFLAKSEVFADLGRCTDYGFEQIEIGGLPIDAAFVLREGEELLAARNSVHLQAASMATVSCASGNRKRARMVSERFGVEVENMEGAACALVCKTYGVKLIELRSVSNLAGDADRTRWDISGALGLLKNGFIEAVELMGLCR